MVRNLKPEPDWKKDFDSQILTRSKIFSKYVPSAILIFSLFFLIKYLNFPDPDPRRPHFSNQSWDARENIVDAKILNVSGQRDEKKIRTLVNAKPAKRAKRGLDKLSHEFQERIRKTQQQGCEGITLLCGHSDRCGFDCQFHHRAACLMISVSLNIPLIHNYSNWPYAEPWNDIFYPLGSNCSVNNSTIMWDWKPRRGMQDKRITFDLRKVGLPIPKSIHDRLKVLHPAPFRWVVGQFLKYALRLSECSERKLEKWSEEIGLSDWRNETKVEKIVGFHVRRTDKFKDTKRSYHEISEYVSKAESYFLKMEKNDSGHLPRRVLLFSDDNQVLHDAKKKYPLWDIRGFNSTIDHSAYKQPNATLSVMEIFRAVFLLSKCDYLICGFSSNVCRLLLEIMSFEHKDDPRERVVSLDGSYMYLIRSGIIPRLFVYSENNSTEYNRNVLQEKYIVQ